MPNTVTDSSARLHAIVFGRVQGVYYRSTTCQQAQILGIRGWVRNRSDGTVETIAEGSRPQLMLFLDYLRIGPHAASVTHVDVSWENFKDEFAKFQIRP